MVNDVDKYLNKFPDSTRHKLLKIRSLIHELIPDVKEKMAYGIPTYYLEKNLIHFAGYKNHIGIYPGPKIVRLFANNLNNYKTSKGAIQIPINFPLPIVLISKIIKSTIV